MRLDHLDRTGALVARLTRGKLKKVVRAYRHVLRDQPMNHTARLKVARALRLLGRNEEAIQEYSSLAYYLAREGDLFGAISACKSILDLDPQHKDTQLNLARLYALTPSPDAPGRVAMPFDPAALPTGPGQAPALPPSSELYPPSATPQPNATPQPQFQPTPPPPPQLPGTPQPATGTPQPHYPGPEQPRMQSPEHTFGGGAVSGIRIGDVGSISAPTGWSDPVYPSTVELGYEDLEVVEELGRQIGAGDPDDIEAIPTLVKHEAYAPAPPDPMDEEDEVPTGLMRAEDHEAAPGDTAVNPSALAEAAIDELLGGDRSASETDSEDPTMVVDFSSPDPDIPPASPDIDGEGLASTIAAGLDQPSVVAGRQDSMAAIELRDSEFEIIDSETDSGEVIDTARLTEGWDRIAEGLARESDDSLLKASAGPSPPLSDRTVTREGGSGPRTPSGGLIPGSSVDSPVRATDGPVPEIPLFSSLSRASFVRLVERMGRRRLAPGEVLVAGGAGAEAIHVIARGSLRATRDGDDGRPVLLARLGPGEFVGEFTFLTGVPSPATLSAEVESEVLRISNAVMRSVVEEHPEVETVLWRFFVDRMTHSLLATSALFQGLTPERQVEIGRLFKPLEVRSGSTVIREGEPSAGLYLVVSGGVDVLVGKGEARRRVASLTPGEFFGLRTAASGTPPTSRVVTTEDSMLLVLPSSDFREILEKESSVRVAVDTVSGMRRLLTNALFQGQTSYSSDGLLKF